MNVGLHRVGICVFTAGASFSPKQKELFMNLRNDVVTVLFRRLSGTGALIVLMLSFALTALANEPEIIKATVINLPRTGDAARIQCQLQVTNPGSIPLIVEIPATRSPLGYALAAMPGRVLLASRQQLIVGLSIQITTGGKHQVVIPLVVRDQRGALLNKANAVIYLAVNQGRYTQSTYRELFMNPVAIEYNESGEREQLYLVGPAPAGWRDGADFNERNADVEELELMERATLFKTDWRESPTLPLPPPKLREEGFEFIRNPLQALIPDMVGVENFTLTAQTSSAVSAQGTLKFTGADGMLHPCYGWKVVAIANVPGQKIEVAKTTVKTTGNWQMNLPVGFPVKIIYRPRNRFFSFADVEDNTYYSFSSQIIYQTLPGGTINELTQVVYNANDTLVNLGELYRAGMGMWNRFKNEAENVSPLREETIVIYYPNTAYDCEGDKLWSCASPAGFIWVLGEHGSDPDNLIHELAHQVNYEYWDNDVPGEGGQHDLNNCITAGNALVEGFADFMEDWVSRIRSPHPSITITPPSIETPSSSACTTDNLNETWVAATFWDLHDGFIDGSDNYMTIKPGSTPAIYLKAGRRDHMGEFKSVYKSYVSDQNKPKIEAIFDQNHQ